MSGIIAATGFADSAFAQNFYKSFLANGRWELYVSGLGRTLEVTVLALLLCAGWNNTAYYPSVADLQSSLTIGNSCSSPFTLEVMSYVSILVPFVLGFIFYAWRALDLRKISGEEMQEKDTHAY